MKRISKFQQQRFGAPVYTCRCCQHQTRETGDDESGVELCAPCYELSGLENTQSDCGLQDAYLRSSIPTIQARIAQIEKRGNGDAGWRQVFAQLLA